MIIKDILDWSEKCNRKIKMNKIKKCDAALALLQETIKCNLTKQQKS